jgi:hypothetical protein
MQKLQTAPPHCLFEGRERAHRLKKYSLTSRHAKESVQSIFDSSREFDPQQKMTYLQRPPMLSPQVDPVMAGAMACDARTGALPG